MKKTTLTKAMVIAVAALGLSFSMASLADHDRGRHFDRHYGDRHYSRHYDQHRKYAYRHKGHWKKHHRGYGHHRPIYRSRTVIHYHDDDLYKWVGGIYLLNEVLHHHRH